MYNLETGNGTVEGLTEDRGGSMQCVETFHLALGKCHFRQSSHGAYLELHRA